jgi:hypothetical protein
MWGVASTVGRREAGVDKTGASPVVKIVYANFS